MQIGRGGEKRGTRRGENKAKNIFERILRKCQNSYTDCVDNLREASR
jgi:hypothetical protein